MVPERTAVQPRGVPKRAEASEAFRRHVVGYPSARAALQAYLTHIDVRAGDRILLPAYIGWSPREGSGVFDPVAALRLEPVFYRVDRHLNLDLDHFASQVIDRRPRAALLIHYFGRVDPSAADACAIARASGVPVIEDAAHALFAVVVSGVAGQLGDATILSLHKMLPVAAGGAIVCRPGDAPRSSSCDVSALYEYDLASISACRVKNAARLVDLVRPLAGSIDLLWPSWAAGHIPQTVPVILRNCNRYEVYQRMNALGFGVVSLYHTLIQQISRDEYPMSYEIADRILNLPVHQDVPFECLVPMVETLREVVSAPQATS